MIELLPCLESKLPRNLAMAGAAYSGWERASLADGSAPEEWMRHRRR